MWAQPPKDENEVIRAAVEGTLRVLRAAKDAGVKRVVINRPKENIKPEKVTLVLDEAFIRTFQENRKLTATTFDPTYRACSSILASPKK
jgi:nucleoside-diphosphate-sugar epimerase